MSEQNFLKDYNPSDYDRPSLTVDDLVFTVKENNEENYRKLAEKELCVLLIKRNNHPDLGKWALPGGFIKLNESLEEASYRTLQDKTNVSNAYLEQLYTFGDIDRDPRTRVVSSAFMALINSDEVDLRVNDASVDIKWFNLTKRVLEEKKVFEKEDYTFTKIVEIMLSSEDVTLSAQLEIKSVQHQGVKRITRKILSSDGLAFDHGLIINYGLERLRTKIEYTDLAFNLMHETFTLTELQKVYEVILGKKLLAANFRRKTNKYVEETDLIKEKAGHRPARLFKHKKIENYEFY